MAEQRQFGGQAIAFLCDVMRLYLGAWMVINGLNHWLPIFPQPFGGSAESQLFITALVDTGLFGVAKAVEVIGGILLIFNLFTPFALVLLLPVSAMVYFNATVLQGRWLMFANENGLYMGTFCLYINLILMLAYIAHYIPFMNVRGRLGKPAHLTQLLHIFNARAPGSHVQTTTGDCASDSDRAVDIAGSKAWWFSAAVGLLLCGLVTWQLRPLGGEFTVSSGKTGREVVAAYLAMAYDEGRGADAARLYFAPDVQDFATDAADRTNGTAINHQIFSIIADGMTVAVHHRIEAARGAQAMEVVDIFKADRFSRISEVRRVSALAVAPAPLTEGSE